MEKTEKTFIFIKPEANMRPSVGARILQRLLDAGLELLSFQEHHVTPEQAREHYAEHAEKSFYPTLEAQILAGPVIACVFQAPEVISRVRSLAGATFVENAELGTLRGDFGLFKGLNVIHASDSPESATREIELWKGFGAVNIEPQEALSKARDFISKWQAGKDHTSEIKAQITQILTLKEKIKQHLQKDMAGPSNTPERLEKLLHAVFLYIAE